MSIRYGFTQNASGSFDDVVERTTQALADEGFGIITEIDMQATLKKKIDVDRKPYKILGACNPKLANQALGEEIDIGLLLPCNVVVRENDNGAVTVGFLDPTEIFKLVDNAQVAPLAEDIKARLKRVVKAII